MLDKNPNSTKDRIKSMLTVGAFGFYLILLVGVICTVLLVTIMLLI